MKDKGLALVIVCMLILGGCLIWMVYDNEKQSKVCESKGGIYIQSHCVKEIK